MTHLYLVRLLIIAALLVSMQACTHDDDEDGIVNEKDKCTNTPNGVKVDKNGCPVVKEIGDVHFYIETSASMGGYFKEYAEYKTIVSDLTTKIDKSIKPIDVWFIAETVAKYPMSIQQLSSDFATTKIADQKSSELHKIISRIAAKNDSNDVTLLVSDCILSFSDKDIKTNPEINKQEAPNALKNNVYSTFVDLKKKGLATSIYAFSSKFYGTYYNYQNDKTELKGSKRPFYIWVIADKEILAKFNTKLNDIPSFKPEKSLHFGMSEEPVTEYSIISQIEKSLGDGRVYNGGVEEIGKHTKVSSDNPLKFCVALNLENLPEYAQDIAYLQKNIKIENNGCEATFEVIDKKKIDKSKLKSDSQIRLYENATHTIFFKIYAMALSQAKVEVTLPLSYDTWYTEWSIMDDKNMSESEGKTFALEHLITGVKDAYETKNKNYIHFSINLNK